MDEVEHATSSSIFYNEDQNERTTIVKRNSCISVIPTHKVISSYLRCDSHTLNLCVFATAIDISQEYTKLAVIHNRIIVKIQ
jgi:hypothetical protein